MSDNGKAATILFAEEDASPDVAFCGVLGCAGHQPADPHGCLKASGWTPIDEHLWRAPTGVNDNPEAKYTEAAAISTLLKHRLGHQGKTVATLERLTGAPEILACGHPSRCLVEPGPEHVEAYPYCGWCQALDEGRKASASEESLRRLVEQAKDRIEAIRGRADLNSEMGQANDDVDRELAMALDEVAVSDGALELLGYQQDLEAVRKQVTAHLETQRRNEKTLEWRGRQLSKSTEALTAIESLCREALGTAAEHHQGALQADLVRLVVERLTRLQAVVHTLCEDDLGLPICVDGEPLTMQCLASAAMHYQNGCSFAVRTSKSHVALTAPVRWQGFTFQPGGCYPVKHRLDDGSVVVEIEGQDVSVGLGRHGPVEQEVGAEIRQMVADGYRLARAGIERALLGLTPGDVSTDAARVIARCHTNPV